VTTPEKTNANWQRFEDRCYVRRLPEPLRRQLRRIHNPCLLTEPLKLVLSRVDEIAAREELVRHVGDEAFFPRSYIPAIHLRRIHRQIMRDETLVAHVRNEVDLALEDANRDRRLEVAERGYPTRLPNCRPPATGTWVVRSELGFGLASQFEGKPEGLAVGLAQRTWDRSALGACGDREDVGLDEHVHLKVLDQGSFGGMTSHALAATKPSYDMVTVYETDSIGEVTKSPFVVAAEDTSEADTTPCDLIVINVPPPGKDGSFQYRNRFKTPSQRHLFDMGNVGPKRWRSGLHRLLRVLALLLAQDGEMVLLLPESVRVERSYEPSPQLLDGLRELLVAQGLVITHDVEVIETRPAPQPFVGTNRPARRCVIAQHIQSEVVGEVPSS
jgi:hypothetical protein